MSQLLINTLTAHVGTVNSCAPWRTTRHEKQANRRKSLSSTRVPPLFVAAALSGTKSQSESVNLYPSPATCVHLTLVGHCLHGHEIAEPMPTRYASIRTDVQGSIQQIFSARSDGTGRVVRNEAGETLSVNAHWFVPAVRGAGIKDFRWHDCRHTYASRLRQAGVPLGNIAELLGHKGLAMSRRYAHLSISNLHEAVSRIANSTPVAPEPLQGADASGYLH